jgi:hypothetical protein
LVCIPPGKLCRLLCRKPLMARWPPRQHPGLREADNPAPRGEHGDARHLDLNVDVSRKGSWTSDIRDRIEVGAVKDAHLPIKGDPHA